MAITVLVADASATARQETTNLLRRDRTIDLVGEAHDGREAVDLARTLRPNVAVVAAAIIGLDAISVVEEINRASPDTAVIVLVDEPDMDLMRRLMRAGARDCIVRPVKEDLLGTVRSIHETMQKQREAISASHAPQIQQGKVIAVYSPQGGAGKSMLAANLGVALARAVAGTKERVVLVDLNLQFGDIDLMLNLNPVNTIAGLAQKGHTGLDSELVEQYLTTHEESGLKILVAPSTPQYAESVTVYTVEQALEALRETYNYIIVDTPSQLQDTTLAALDAANTILLLTSLDLLALHKTRTALDMLRQLYPADKIQIILNRANSEVGITIADVESALGSPLRAQIPSDGRLVVTSVNEGKPFVISAPQTVIARRLQSLASEILGRDATPTEASQNGGGFLKRIFG
jgi:pilus assembly protein CpaE